jgi:RNA polymerase sigma factor (sigma-70 family)
MGPALEETGATSDARTAETFDACFLELYPRLARALARVVGDRSQAEELAADAFCRLHARYGRLDAESRRPWVFRAGINLAIDALRANARRLRRELLADVAARQPDALGDLVASEERRRVRLALARLPRQQARVLILASQGWSYRDAAEVLGLRPDSVYTLVARAKARFERHYLSLPGGNRD